MDVPILGSNPLAQETRQLPVNGPKIRLLFCLNCKTIEELPDFEGRPEDDVLLEITVERHQSSGIPHAGHLMKVPLVVWEIPKVREEIVKQIRQQGSSGLDVIMPGFYDTKNNFFEDAMACYAAHMRPKGQCADFRTEKKRLVPKTHAERKEAGLAAPGTTGPKVYLCDFCPVRVFNERKAREQKGLYK